MAPPTSFREITISYDPDTGKVVVKPDPAPVYWNTGPDSARWTGASSSGHPFTFDVVFEDGRSPFRDVHSVGTPPAYAVVGTENTRVGGSYKYTVVIRGEAGSPVAELDPVIDNSGEPNPDP